MTEINFDTEWQDGDGINGAELAATFASLRIDVCGQSVTRVFDRRASTVRDSVYVPLYPFAEWLVSNWWFLAYEFENPTKNGDPEFAHRHALGTNTEGYAFPDLVAVSADSRTRLTWGNATSPWNKIVFLSRGQASVDKEEFRNVCAALIDRVVRRLTAYNIHDTFLQEEWIAIQGADDEESSFCETAAGLGWDPYALDEVKRTQVLQLAEELGHLCSEAVPVMDTLAPLKDSAAIASALESARPNSLQLQRLRPLIDESLSLADHQGHPWKLGYSLAQRARGLLGLDGQPVRTMRLLAEALGEDVEHATRPIPSLEMVRLIDGVVTSGEHNGVSFGLGKTGENRLRFLFCRALAEAIVTKSDSLITRGHTVRQQCNRAFAAEFLAPSFSLRPRISRRIVDGEEVDDLAEEFGVSTQVIEHQIENHGIAQVDRLSRIDSNS